MPAKKKQSETVLEGQLQPKKAKPMITADHDDEAQMMAASIMSSGFKIAEEDLPVANGKLLTGTDLQNLADRLLEKSANMAMARGLTWIAMKRELGHGAFEGWLKSRGVSPVTARNDRRVADLVMGLSDSNRLRANDLPHRKQLVLASLPAPVVDDLFNEGALDQADKLSRDDLQEIVRLRKEVETQGKKYDNLNKQVAKLRDESRKTKALPEEQVYIRSLRAAVLEETQQLNVLAHGLQQMLDSAALLPPDTPQAQLDSVAHPLMYSLQALYATATKLHDRAFEVFTDFKPDVDVLPPKLEPDEVEEAKRLSREFTDQMALRAKFRDADLGLTAKGKGK